MHHSRNQSTGVFFVFLEFSEYPNLQVPLFLVFLIMYTITVLENLGMILVIRINAKLHTPMYFFLSHLSFIDLCYTTVIAPKLLDFLITTDRSMSIKECIVQFYFGCACVVAQTFMLAVMAYDRFVAICNPLLYTVAMSHRPCTFLVTITYLWGGSVRPHSHIFFWHYLTVDLPSLTTFVVSTLPSSQPPVLILPSASWHAY